MAQVAEPPPDSRPIQRVARRKTTTTALSRLLVREKSYEEDYERLGLTEEEINEACSLFKERLKELWSDATPKFRRNTLKIDDVDLVMRQLRVFVSTRFIMALFIEVDEDGNGLVDQEEFLMMVAKLRGRRPLSTKFYVRTLSRALKERYSKFFTILDQDQDGLLDEEGIVTGFRQLNPHINTDSEDFRQILSKLDGGPTKQFSLDDFLALQAKLRRPPAAVDAALLSLTLEETERYEQAFQEWRETRNPNVVSPQELRQLMSQLDYPAPWDQVKSILEELELERISDLQPSHFLYLLVNVGAGSCTRPRLVLSPSASYEDAFKIGYPLEELWELGYDDLQQIRRSGWSAQHVHRAGLADTFQLREAGYTAAELRKVGMDARELKLAGFGPDELRNAGFSSAVLRDCCNVVASRPKSSAGEALPPPSAEANLRARSAERRGGRSPA